MTTIIGTIVILIILWVIGYGLSKRNIFLVPRQEGAVKFIKKNEEFSRFLNGIKAHHVIEAGDQMGKIEAGSSKNSNGPDSVLWGSEFILSPLETVHTWTETYNHGVQKTELAKSLGIKCTSVRMDHLPHQRTIQIAIVNVEIAGGYGIDIYVKVTIQLINAYEAVYGYLPSGKYLIELISAIYGRVVDFVGPDERNYEWMLKTKHAELGSDFRNAIQGIGDDHKDGVIAGGHRVIDATWLNFEISGDADSKEVRDAMQAVVINEHNGEAEIMLEKKREKKSLHTAAINKNIGESYKKNPEVLHEKIAEHLSRTPGALSFGNEGFPFTINVEPKKPRP